MPTDTAWLRALKAGDEVIVYDSWYGAKVERVCTVARLTPKGRVVINFPNGSGNGTHPRQFHTADNWQAGREVASHDPGRLRQATPEKLAEMAAWLERQAMKKNLQQAHTKPLTDDQLRRICAILDEKDAEIERLKTELESANNLAQNLWAVKNSLAGKLADATGHVGRVLPMTAEDKTADVVGAIAAEARAKALEEILADVDACKAENTKQPDTFIKDGIALGLSKIETIVSCKLESIAALAAQPSPTGPQEGGR